MESLTNKTILTILPVKRQMELAESILDENNKFMNIAFVEVSEGRGRWDFYRIIFNLKYATSKEIGSKIAEHFRELFEDQFDCFLDSLYNELNKIFLDSNKDFIDDSFGIIRYQSNMNKIQKSRHTMENYFIYSLKPIYEFNSDEYLKLESKDEKLNFIEENIINKLLKIYEEDWIDIFYDKNRFPFFLTSSFENLIDWINES